MVDARQVMGLARCVASMAAVAAVAGRPDRWILNTGAEMALGIWGVSPMGEDGQPEAVRAVVDLAGLVPTNPTIMALRNHDTERIVGSFAALGVGPEGFAGDLSIAKPSSPTSLPDAREVQDMRDAGVPLQASIGMRPDHARGGRWEQVAPGTSVVVNGRTFAAGAADETPLYILRNGEVFESSIVTFGADGDTGRLAAAARLAATNHPSKGNSMSDTAKRLGVLFAKFKDPRHQVAIANMLIATPEADDKTVEKAMAELDGAAEVVALKAQKDAAEARASAAEAECATLKTKVAEHETAIAKLKDPTGTAAAAAAAATGALKVQPNGAGSGEAPKTIGEGMAKLKNEGFADGKANRGSLLHAEALKRWPAALRR